MIWDQEQPCKSCPYRKDSPKKLWERWEFENLLAQDANEYGGSAFGCHQTNKKPRAEQRPCAGWLLDQKKRGYPSMQLRMMLAGNEEAQALVMRITGAGLKLYASIAAMCRANGVRPPKRRDEAAEKIAAFRKWIAESSKDAP